VKALLAWCEAYTSNTHHTFRNARMMSSTSPSDSVCAFLGSTAGNVALTLGARGGVFIGGGIALHFTEFLRRSAFRERFEAKGRMAGYLARIPTAIIVHPTPAFLGLADLARKAAHRTSS
jgi:glucokinase